MSVPKLPVLGAEWEPHIDKIGSLFFRGRESTTDRTAVCVTWYEPDGPGCVGARFEYDGDDWLLDLEMDCAAFVASVAGDYIAQERIASGSLNALEDE